MGASGAGKTTLMDVLAGRKTSAVTSHPPFPRTRACPGVLRYPTSVACERRMREGASMCGLEAQKHRDRVGETEAGGVREMKGGGQGGKRVGTQVKTER
jgi:hypothetical protein